MAAFATSCAVNPPLNIQENTFLVELVELGASQHDIALSVHRNDLLGILTHEEVLAEDYVIEDTTGTEDVADWLRFCGHVFDVDDLGGNVARSTAAYEEVVRIIGYCG